jgi:hypothetical protein
MQIEKGVEIPPDGRGKGQTSSLGKWQKLAQQMEVGDSVFFAGDRDNRSFRALSRVLLDMGYKTVSRWVGDGHRVWRVK